MSNFELLHAQEMLKNLVHSVEKIYPAMIFDAGEYSRLENSKSIESFDNYLEDAIQYLTKNQLYIEPKL